MTERKKGEGDKEEERKRAKESQVVIERAELISVAGDERPHPISAYAALRATKKDDGGVSQEDKGRVWT